MRPSGRGSRAGESRKDRSAKRIRARSVHSHAEWLELVAGYQAYLRAHEHDEPKAPS